MKRAPANVPILPVLLAGGAGARLAPISTPQQPKQFIPLPDGRSLMTRALMRVADHRYFEHPLIIGPSQHRFALLNHVRAAGLLPHAILLEPQARNTAMAIACAASYALKYKPDTVLAILPADQMIEPVDAWVAAIREAADIASHHETLCLLGVTPTRPDPQFGYITLGERLGESNASSVTQFVEKPENPETYLATSVWNAGQFIAPARVIESMMLEHTPALWMAAQHAVASMEKEWEFHHLGQASFTAIPSVSFDRAVVEKSTVLCIRLSAHWHDLGTVPAWEAYTCQAAESYTRRPPRVDRPWGFYELLSQTESQAQKRLTIFPGCRLSMQRHQFRSETWHILEGTAEIELEGEKHVLVSGEYMHIKPYEWHRLANNGIIPLIIHEIQEGTPDESDIERADDDYGRHTNTQLYYTNI